MMDLSEYTVTFTNREDTVLVHGTDFDGEWVHKWPITDPAPTLAEIIERAQQHEGEVCR